MQLVGNVCQWDGSSKWCLIVTCTTEKMHYREEI